MITTQQLQTARSRRPASHKRLILSFAALYPLLLLALSTVNIVQPRRTGLLGLSEVFGPFLFLPLLVLVPFALIRGATFLRLLLLFCAIIYGLRFPPKLLSVTPQSDPSAIHLSVMSWNVLVGGWYDEVKKVLVSRPAAIVGLVEANWERIAADPDIAAVYPYRMGVEAAGPVSGQVLLTTYPIIEQGVIDAPADVWGNVPRAIWARLDVGLGRNLFVVVAHPPPGRTCSRATFPRGCYDTTTRDKQLEALNAFVRPHLQAGEAVLMVGDFNVTDREPAYSDISRGLLDTQRAAGAGIGATWAPGNLSSKLFPLLRIDYHFASPSLVPLAIYVDCTNHGSDHCIVASRFEMK